MRKKTEKQTKDRILARNLATELKHASGGAGQCLTIVRTDYEGADGTNRAWDNDGPQPC